MAKTINGDDLPPTQRRPAKDQAQLRQCDEEFLRKLREATVKHGEAARILREAGEKAGYEFDPSLISRMKKGEVPTSRAVEPICQVMSWSFPPPADAVGLSAEVQGKVGELAKLDPERLERVRDYLDDMLEGAKREKLDP